MSVSPIKFLKKNKENFISVKIVEKQFFVNGNFYIINSANLIKYKNFHNKESEYFINNTYKESIDIDTKRDWLDFKKLV